MFYVPGAYCATIMLRANSWSTYCKQHLPSLHVYSYFTLELKTGRHLYNNCKLQYRCHSAERYAVKNRESGIKASRFIKPCIR